MNSEQLVRKTIEGLRRTERTNPKSPFWEGWDAALVAVEVALDHGSRGKLTLPPREPVGYDTIDERDGGRNDR